MRAGRVSALALSLYSAGYTKGVVDSSLDPEAARLSRCRAVLSELADASGNLSFCPPGSEEVKAVRRVLPRVLAGAREQLRRMRQQLEEEVMKSGGTASPAQEQRQSHLSRAAAQLDAWKDDGFIVVDVNSPNAFVTGMVPGLIFVHRGIFRHDFLQPVGSKVELGESVLVRKEEPSGERWKRARVAAVSGTTEATYAVAFDDDSKAVVTSHSMRRLAERRIVESDEQLAMLLGHELAHVVHDHCDDSLRFTAAAAGLQLVLLSMIDPTGLLSLFAELGAAMIMKYGFILPVSRCNESEADLTGLQICALARFDPRSATTFFDRMLAMEAEELPDGSTPAWINTHPATTERLRALHAAEAAAVRVFDESAAWLRPGNWWSRQSTH